MKRYTTSFSNILTTYAEYNCEKNSISVEELFEKYEQLNFIYPEKKKIIAPFFELIKNNWRILLSKGHEVFWIISYCDPNKNFWSSICSFRTTHNSWATQHLVSNNPLGSRATMLSAQAVGIHENLALSHQSWFQPTNKYANKIFGSIVNSVGSNHSVVNTYNYLRVPLSTIQGNNFSRKEVTIESWHPRLKNDFIELVSLVRGKVYIRAEELDHPDVLLEELNKKYKKIGLKRFRRIWLAFCRDIQEPLGCIIAYCGPLGINFSFLENRVDLIVHPSATNEQAKQVVASLIHSAYDFYKDCSLGSIFVTTDDQSSEILKDMGGEFVRKYSQSIWLNEGFEAWYSHTEKIFKVVEKFEERRKKITPLTIN